VIGGQRTIGGVGLRRSGLIAGGVRRGLLLSVDVTPVAAGHGEGSLRMTASPGHAKSPAARI